MPLFHAHLQITFAIHISLLHSPPHSPTTPTTSQTPDTHALLLPAKDASSTDPAVHSPRSIQLQSALTHARETALTHNSPMRRSRAPHLFWRVGAEPCVPASATRERRHGGGHETCKSAKTVSRLHTLRREAVNDQQRQATSHSRTSLTLRLHRHDGCKALRFLPTTSSRDQLEVLF